MSPVVASDSRCSMKSSSSGVRLDTLFSFRIVLIICWCFASSSGLISSKLSLLLLTADLGRARKLCKISWIRDRSSFSSASICSGDRRSGVSGSISSVGFICLLLSEPVWTVSVWFAYFWITVAGVVWSSCSSEIAWNDCKVDCSIFSLACLGRAAEYGCLPCVGWNLDGTRLLNFESVNCNFEAWEES